MMWGRKITTESIVFQQEVVMIGTSGFSSDGISNDFVKQTVFVSVSG